MNAGNIMVPTCGPITGPRQARVHHIVRPYHVDRTPILNPRDSKIRTRCDRDVGIVNSAYRDSAAALGGQDTLIEPINADHAAMLNAVQPGDLIEVVCPMTSHQGNTEGEDKDGRMSLYIEVRKCRKNREATVVEGICEGEVVQIEATEQLRIKHLGHWPRLSDPWVKNNSHLQKALKDIRKKQADTHTLPSEIINACATGGKQCGFRLQHVTSLPEFRSRVSADTSYWCDGVGPDDEQPTPFQIAMQTTGELLTFMLGARGVMVVQLDVGYDLGSVRVPLLRPFVLQCLQEVSTMKGVCVFSSVLDTKSTASSMVLASKAQPYQSWGRHLAKLGVQASIVADSPYYKYLIGMILGYKEENIIHHITSTGQRLEASVMAAARQELENLNPTPPCLSKNRSAI